MSISNNQNTDSVEEVSTKKIQITEPPQYKVILHNDDYTPMDFVVEVLVTIFRKNHSDATQIMLKIHHQGSAVCGVYSYEIAEMKIAQVHQISTQHSYPLKSTLEKA